MTTTRINDLSWPEDSDGVGLANCSEQSTKHKQHELVRSQWMVKCITKTDMNSNPLAHESSRKTHADQRRSASSQTHSPWKMTSRSRQLVALILFFVLLTYREWNQFMKVASLSAKEKVKPNLRLVHAVAPFASTTASSRQSVHPHQWLAFESIQRAMNHISIVADVDVVLHCTVVSSEADQLQEFLDTYCTHLTILPRTTRTEFAMVDGNKTRDKELPFLQDIFQATTTVHQSVISIENVSTLVAGKDNLLWIYSNADIGVSTDFYALILKKILEEGYEALSINRMTLPTAPFQGLYSTVPPCDSSVMVPDNENTGACSPASSSQRHYGNHWLLQVDQLMAESRYDIHHGYDCFVVSSNAAGKFKTLFGNMFVGYPPWGDNLHHALKLMGSPANHLASKSVHRGKESRDQSDLYVNLPSSTQATFHIGDDRSAWAVTDNDNHYINDYTTDGALPSDQQKRQRLDQLWAQSCPGIPATFQNWYTYQNCIQCGKWWWGDVQDQVTLGRKENSKLRKLQNTTIPAFVAGGFEDSYVHRYQSVLSFDPASGKPKYIRNQPLRKSLWRQILKPSSP